MRNLSPAEFWTPGRLAALLFLVALAFLPPVCLLAAQQSPPAAAPDPGAEQPPSEPEVPEVIPVTEVSSKAEVALKSLRNISKRAEQDPEIESIQTKLAELEEELEVPEEGQRQEDLLRTNLRSLLELQRVWEAHRALFEKWEKTLASRTKGLEADRTTLGGMRELWERSREAAVEGEAPEAVLERIDSTLQAIDETDPVIAERRDSVLTFQDQLARQSVRVGEHLELIGAAAQEMRGRIFILDSPPIWSVTVEGTGDSLGQDIAASWSAALDSIVRYAPTARGRALTVLIIFAVLLGLLLLLRRAGYDWHVPGLVESGQVTAHIRSRPCAGALLLSMILGLWLFPDRPSVVSEVLVALLLLPWLRLMPGLFRWEIRKALYLLAALFFLQRMGLFSLRSDLSQRLLLLVVSGVVFGAIWWLIRGRAPLLLLRGAWWWRVLGAAAPLALIILAVGFVANLVGAVRLASLLTQATIDSACIAAILYPALLVADGVLVSVLRQPPATYLHLVQNRREQIERGAFVLLHLGAILLWLEATLNQFHLSAPLAAWVKEVAIREWQIGTASVSVAGVLAFPFILFVAWLIARSLRVVLREEVFSRFRLPRGVAGAVSTLVGYVIIGFGIVLAIAALGIDMSKFAILAGALGVGLGFGLQNIVANFISGLIVIFERPIQIGDTIEVGNLMGNVTDIGVRSSKVRTFDGAEVIVPNNDLISKQLINWTYSDRIRRVKWPVKVAYGSDPHRVLEILRQVPALHPDVLGDPEPLPLFDGFSDNSMNFTLLYWIPTAKILTARSEVGVGIFDGLQEAGIRVPVPRSDVTLLPGDAPSESGEPDTSE